MADSVFIFSLLLARSLESVDEVGFTTYRVVESIELSIDNFLLGREAGRLSGGFNMGASVSAG